MAKRSSNIDYYASLYRTCSILPEWEDRVDKQASQIAANKARYATSVVGTSIPWVFPALIHILESGGRFDCQILNGQKWNKVTTIEPIGKGPWTSWLESTRYALRAYTSHQSWSPAFILQQLEKHNGWGYRYRGVHSPYLWSGTNHGVGVGKYVSDGTYSPSAVSKQVGAAALFLKLADE